MNAVIDTIDMVPPPVWRGQAWRYRNSANEPGQYRCDWFVKSWDEHGVMLTMGYRLPGNFGVVELHLGWRQLHERMYFSRKDHSLR
jgi:hypothetical protein